jgi:hypothetical protein
LNPIKRKPMEDRVQAIEDEITRVGTAIGLHETQLQQLVSVEKTQRQTNELEDRAAGTHERAGRAVGDTRH